VLVNPRLKLKKKQKNIVRPNFHVSSVLILTFEEERIRKIGCLNVNLFQQIIDDMYPKLLLF